MENNSRFSVFLSELLDVLNISNNKLAKAINVDPSLISRWKTGKRRISADSNYLKLTADYLSENVYCDSEKESISQLAYKYNLSVNIDLATNTKEYLYRLLLSALQNSSSFQIMNAEANSIDENKKHTKSFLCPIEVITGHRNVINAALELLKSLPEKPHYINEPILITFLTDTASFSNFDETLVEWNNTLLEVQHKGWSIKKLIKINDNNLRNCSIINELLYNIHSKNYSQHYISKYDIVLNFREILLVPTIGSLSCLCSKTDSKIDSAFLLKDKEAIKIFEGFIDQYLIHSLPLINKDHNMSLLGLLAEFAAFEEEAAPSFAFNSCLNYTKLPIKIHESHASSNDEMINFHNNIKKAFITKLEQFDFFEIHSKKYIKDIIKKSKSKNSSLKPSHVIEAFEYMITLLEKYDNYNIALLNENSTSNALHEFTWNIKDNNTVLLGTLCENYKDNNKACVTITEPNIVNTFNKYFIELWDSIAPINKEKDVIISWLKAQIKSLQEI